MMKNQDHRKIAQTLGLWTFSDLVGSGLPLFTPRGTTIRNELFKSLSQMSENYGAELVTIPHIAKRKLYEVSGHAQKFGDELLRVISHFDEFVMKPVNCPHHTQIYAAEPKSYRDLPVRYIESTMQYRDEQPGEIGGLTRVRAITVDDGHIFCTQDQIKQEIYNIAEIIKEFYSQLGMWGNHWVSLSTRDMEHLEKYIGEKNDWEQAENTLQKVSDELKLNAKKCPGEAALYGPKLDYIFTDSLGREWQLATIQIDFAMPKRFELSYVGEDGENHTPVMIHRAILGSYERFLAILLEHFNGWLPAWLAPVQIAVLPISKEYEEMSLKLKDQLKEKGIRVKHFYANESVSKRIRESKVLKIPFLVVIGENERKENTIKIQRNKNGNNEYMGNIADCLNLLSSHILDRKL